MALLDGQVALVTGGASGIGLAIARRFAAEGARVMIADIRPEEAKAAAQAAAADGLELHPQEVDVTDEGSVQQAFDLCAERLGVPEAVVANAGILTLAPVAELEVERFRRVLEVNLTGAFLTAQAAVRGLLAADRSGSISVTSSIAGIRGLSANAAYSASKFGVTGLVQALAIEVAGAGIRVNAVAPGQVDTQMARDVTVTRAAERGVSIQAAEEAMLSRIAMGRLAQPEEIADAFVYLASPLARYVTGHTLVADGGWLLT